MKNPDKRNCAEKQVPSKIYSENLNWKPRMPNEFLIERLQYMIA